MSTRSIDLAEYCRPVAFVVQYEYDGSGDGNCEVVWDTSAQEAFEWAADSGNISGEIVSVKREPLFDRGESPRVWIEAGYMFQCEACHHRVSKSDQGVFCENAETGNGVIVGELVYCSRQCADGCPEEHEDDSE